MPMTPFIGVRISWLMLARNSLLARLAASAASLAARNCASALFRSVMSLTTPRIFTGAPWMSRSTRPSSLIQCRDESGQPMRHSILNAPVLNASSKAA